jgi:hypothetical protein
MAKYLVRDCGEGGADLSSEPVEVDAESALEAAKKVVHPTIALRPAGNSEEIRARVRPSGNADEEILFYADPYTD